MLTAQQWKERRSEELRAIILNAAADVFNGKGFERTTTREIAKRAGVSEGTIYNYFENKRELLLSLVRQFAESASSLFPPDLADPKTYTSTINFAARYFLERLELFSEGLSPTLIFYHAKRDPDVRAILDEALFDGIDRQLRPQVEALKTFGFIRDLDTDFLIGFMRSIVFGLAVQLDVRPIEGGPYRSLEELSTLARDVVWHGITKGDIDE